MRMHTSDVIVHLNACTPTARRLVAAGVSPHGRQRVVRCRCAVRARSNQGLDAELLALKEDRVETKGRFRSKQPMEAELFVRQQKELRKAFPELERERLEEEAKARHKIDELHEHGLWVPDYAYVPNLGG